jgi:hypothetical protein
MENNGIYRLPRQGNSHLRPFVVCWLVTFVTVTGLVCPFLGYHLDNPLLTNTALAGVFYAAWLVAKYYWRKNNLSRHPVVQDAAEWVSEVAKGGDR